MPTFGAAQSAPVVLRASTCASCRIEASRLFTLDNGPDNALLADWPSSISMDSRGRIALAVMGGKGLAILFDSLGRSPRRIGRVGSGPNEYRAPVAAALDHGDTLHVFDLDLARRTSLVGDARLVKSTPYNARTVLVRMLANHELLAVSGTRFYLYSSSGTLLRNWGETLPPVPGGTRLPTRRISNVVSGKYWAVNAETYELEQWTVAGRRLTQVRRVVEWFDPKAEWANGMRGTTPSAEVADLHLDQHGRLWVLVNLPRKAWRDGLGPAATRRGMTYYPEIDFGLVYESRVEVIDVATLRLQQSIRVPAYLRFIVSDTRLAGLRHSEDGSPVVDMWRVGGMNTTLH